MFDRGGLLPSWTLGWTLATQKLLPGFKSFQDRYFSHLSPSPGKKALLTASFTPGSYISLRSRTAIFGQRKTP
jgi:hypothetical protein